MNNNFFEQNWNTEELPLIKFNKEDLAKLGLGDDLISTLSEIGLPVQASPYLSFNMKTLNNIQKEGLGKFVQIGNIDNGDSIVIDVKVGSIDIFSHEDNAIVCSMNSTLSKLYMNLISFENFIGKIQENYGEDAYLDLDFPLSEIELLEQELISNDESFNEQENFWKNEVSQMKDEIQLNG